MWLCLRRADKARDILGQDDKYWDSMFTQPFLRMQGAFPYISGIFASSSYKRRRRPLETSNKLPDSISPYFRAKFVFSVSSRSYLKIFFSNLESGFRYALRNKKLRRVAGKYDTKDAQAKSPTNTSSRQSSPPGLARRGFTAVQRRRIPADRAKQNRFQNKVI